MKTTKILYWVFTALLLALMLFSAFSSFMVNPEGVKIAEQLQYPSYLFKFLAVAKILGAIAILVPGFARLKEWAYAGFFFDLTGALVSFIIVKAQVANWAPIFVVYILLFGSYITYHKLKATKA